MAANCSAVSLITRGGFGKVTGELTGFKLLDLAGVGDEFRVTILVTFGFECTGFENDLGTEREIERGLVNF